MPTPAPISTSMPVLPLASDPARQPAQPVAQDSDPIAGTWSTSGGAWHFTKDGDGYTMVETSALGQTGQGHARLEGATLSVNFISSFLGQQCLTLSLGGRVLQGTMSVMGIGLPLVLRRA
jgi:hypothetical protein